MPPSTPDYLVELYELSQCQTPEKKIAVLKQIEARGYRLGYRAAQRESAAQ